MSWLAVTNRLAPIVPPVTLLWLFMAPVAVLNTNLIVLLIVFDVVMDFAQVAV